MSHPAAATPSTPCACPITCSLAVSWLAKQPPLLPLTPEQLFAFEFETWERLWLLSPRGTSDGRTGGGGGGQRRDDAREGLLVRVGSGKGVGAPVVWSSAGFVPDPIRGGLVGVARVFSERTGEVVHLRMTIDEEHRYSKFA